MATFDSSLTDPPAISTSNPAGTLKGWVGYVFVAAMAILALGLAQNTVVPMLANFVPGTTGEETVSAGFDTSGGGL